METETLQSQSYLTFRLEEEIFAASVLNVIEILELAKITKVPRSPHFMRGVINLRGNVLPVIDTRLKFGLEKTSDTINTCIMVLNIELDSQRLLIGALVDAVQEVLEINPDTVQQPPSIGSKYKSEFIKGMIKMNDQFIMMLDLDKVFSTDEASILQQISEKGE
jgi:purine-binding chemotaxis protein CheW